MVFCALCCINTDYFSFWYGLGASMNGVGNYISYAYANEIYPTKIRSSAVATLLCISRIMSGLSQFVFLYLNDFGPFVVYWLAVVLLVILVIAISVLPYETCDKQLDEEYGHKSEKVDE